MTLAASSSSHSSCLATIRLILEHTTTGKRRPNKDEKQNIGLQRAHRTTDILEPTESTTWGHDTV